MFVVFEGSYEDIGMENAGLELDVISSSEKKQNEKDETKEIVVVEPEATQALVDTVDAAVKHGHGHVKILLNDGMDGIDEHDGIRKKVALKPSPLLYGKKETKKRDKALTIWGKIWRKIRYALPVLLIAVMIIINQSIDKREKNQKKSNTQIDYERLFQVLDRDTPLLKEWQTQEMVRKFYIFNWTNADQIGRFPAVKPHFQEVGPFLFDEILKKIDLVFDPSENQVSFSLDRTNEFNREASLDDLDLQVISPFDTPTLSNISEVLYGSSQSPNPYFYHEHVNPERKGRFTVFTGNENREILNQLVDRQLDTLGDVWSTVSTPDFTHPLRIYSPDVCLSIHFNDIQLTESGRQWSSSCIDMEPVHDHSAVERCKVVKGVNRCRGHSRPPTISFPHFYTDKNFEYDETYLTNVDGLKPDKKRHRPFVRFEMKTGKLLEKRLRLQYNVAYKLSNSR